MAENVERQYIILLLSVSLIAVFSEYWNKRKTWRADLKDNISGYFIQTF